MEKEANLRNKIQASKTVLEILLKDEKPPKHLVEIALKNLEELFEQNNLSDKKI